MRVTTIAIFLALYSCTTCAVSASGEVAIERLAYEVYVGCYNQALQLQASRREDQGLSTELQGCRDLAREVLTRSTRDSATRYLVYVLLLNTDGGESEQNNAALARKRNATSYIKEIRKIVGKECLVPQTRLENQAPNLCASESLVRQRIDLHLGRK